MRCGLLLPLVLALVLLSLVSCSVLQSPLTLDQIKARPEAHLYYPEAVVERVSAAPQANGAVDAGPQDGFVFTDLKTSAEQLAILTWYRQQLTSLSWTERGRDTATEYPDGNGATLAPAPYVWTRGNQESFRLIFRPIMMDLEVKYTAYFGGCVTVSPYPFGDGSCSDGKPVTPIPKHS